MIIYVKNKNLEHMVNRNMKGNIIMSESQELNKICSLYGIVHIFMNLNNVSNDIKIDCIYATERDQTLEETLIVKNVQTPIMYYELNKKWCGVCHALCEPFVSKYCSENCMQSFFDTDLIDLNRNYVLENIFSSSKKNFKTTVIENRSNKKDKFSIDKNSNEKFQTSMIKEAVRLEYALKRESYKKEIRQPSLRKTIVSNNKKTSNTQTNDRICKSVTRKGVKCTNKAVDNSDFCGIISHNKIEE